MNQTITFTKMEGRAGGGYTTFGAPWKKGTVTGKTGYRLTDHKGREIPVQSRITAYWPDGSVKWSSHTANIPGDVGEVRLEAGSAETKDGFIRNLPEAIEVKGDKVWAVIPKQGSHILENLVTEGRCTAAYGILTMSLEEWYTEDGCQVRKQVPYIGKIQSAEIEEAGSEKAVICLKGLHKNEKTGRKVLPFLVRLTFYREQANVHITHTFLYDGDEKKDFLKSLGIRFFVPMAGAVYNRHVKFGGDNGYFHESLKLLLSWRPRVPIELYQAQMRGENLDTCSMDQGLSEKVLEAFQDIPAWSSYHMCQDSAEHFSIKKRTNKEECCYLDCLHGNRGKGVMAVSDETGGMLAGRKDFWQKYPSGFWTEKLDTDLAEVTIWIWNPEAEAMDFRHYDTEGHASAYYEGFDEMGATPYGIANTNEMEIMGFSGRIMGREELDAFALQVQKPMVLLAAPEYYHEVRAFGRWSLPSKDREVEKWLEIQLDKAVNFYKKEIELRGWYGLFNYGDVMHTYDKVRHTWRYDMGGYAWQNTELVPTLWLWYAFMRTGREDIFTLAEAMSRHCSEVDTYHLGDYKGIGSRHNVRHWGCACKEARIAMAGHHRFYYYLTGDHRMEDVFDDVKDGDLATLNIDPMRYFYDKEKMVYPTHARSGPDWSSFCSNWLAEWERHNNNIYRDKIVTGIEDLKKMPLKLISGSDFEYNPEDNHLLYIGERSTGGCHLQICMGAPQTWMEIAELLEDEEWTKMLADFGRFYLLTPEEKNRVTHGLFGERTASFPYMATAMSAFAAEYYKDENLGHWVWKNLIDELIRNNGLNGFHPEPEFYAANQEVLHEIPWISTNFVAQWCLNAIVALDMIREYLPEHFFDMEKKGWLVDLVGEDLVEQKEKG